MVDTRLKHRTKSLLNAKWAVTLVIILVTGLARAQTGQQIAVDLGDKGTCIPPWEPGGMTGFEVSHGTDLALAGGHVIGQLTDPEDPAIDGQIDILAARIELSGDQLTFIIETREPIPGTLPDPADYMTFLWFVDADNDPDTGQPNGDVGSDFNVRAVVSEQWGGGFIDVAGSVPGGGGGTVALFGNRVEMTIGLIQIGSPVHFTWRSDAFQEIGGEFSVNGQTTIAMATTLPHPTPTNITVTPPLLMLSPSGPASGQIELELRDAFGAMLDPGDYDVSYFSSNTGVATVDASGVVTVHSVPVEFWQTPVIDVYVEGTEADNVAVIRSTTTDLGVVHSYYAGQRVSFYLPEVIDGIDLGQLTADYEIVEATDLAYFAQEIATGLLPFGGGTQYFVLEVSDDPDTVPCGLAGNPIRLGWDFGIPAYNNCYFDNDSVIPGPQWSVIFHEMGHSFTLASRSFVEFADAYPPYHLVYAEGLASLAAMWSFESIVECGSGLGSVSLESLKRELTNFRTEVFAGALADYQSAGANYTTFDPDILDGLLFELYDSYGAKVWFDLFSTFLPADEPLPCLLNTRAKQATWFVAAISASVGEDLRSTFVTEYGFPVDNVAWPAILACVQDRIEARDFTSLDGDDDGVGDECDACPTTPAGVDVDGQGRPIADLDKDCSVDLHDFAIFQRSLTGPLE